MVLSVSVTGSSSTTTAAGPDTLGGFDDGLGAMYVAVCDLQQEGVASGNSLVQQTESETQEEQAAQQAALERAQNDASTSGGGFFKDLGKAVGDFVGQLVQLHFGQAIDDLGNDLSQAWSSPHFWTDMSKVMADLSYVSTAVGAVAPLLGPAAAPVEAVTAATKALSTGCVGLAKLRTSDFQADADGAQDDATQAQNVVALLSTREKDFLATLNGQSQSQEGALSTIVQTIQTNDGTRVSAANFRIRG